LRRPIAWSPDGKKSLSLVGFAKLKKISVQQIFVMNVDGSNLTQVNHFSSKDFKEMQISELTFSPDGKNSPLPLASLGGKKARKDGYCAQKYI
jgi:Tol biopolymer transport system component